MAVSHFCSSRSTSCGQEDHVYAMTMADTSIECLMACARVAQLRRLSSNYQTCSKIYNTSLETFTLP